MIGVQYWVSGKRKGTIYSWLFVSIWSCLVMITLSLGTKMGINTYGRQICATSSWKKGCHLVLCTSGVWNSGCEEREFYTENSYRIITWVSLEEPSEYLLVQPPAHMRMKMVANILIKLSIFIFVVQTDRFLKYSIFLGSCKFQTAPLLHVCIK